MKLKKILTLALAGVMTLSTLAGCGSGSSDSVRRRAQAGEVPHLEKIRRY